MKKSTLIALCAALILSAAACSNNPADTNNTAAPTADATTEVSATPEAVESEQPSGQPVEEPSEQPAEDPSEQPVEDPSEQPAEDPSEAPAELSQEEIEAKLVEFTESLNAQYEAMSELFASQGMSCVAKCEGMDSITEYTYLEQVEEFNSETLTAELDAAWSTYKGMYEDACSYVGSEDIRVILRYVNADGTQLLDYVVDKTYHAE